MQEVANEQEQSAVEEKMTGAGVPSRKKELLKNRFTGKRVAFMGIFVAISYVVSLLEIPLPILGAEFLKLDFGNVFIVLISFLMGPLEGVLVCLIKECLRLFGSSSGGAGELANFFITSSYILFPSILYRVKKGLKSVCFSLAVACVIATAMALLCNRLLVFPAYAAAMNGSIFGMTIAQAFSSFWIALLLFNVIKTVLVGIFTLLLYKRLSNFIKKMKI